MNEVIVLVTADLATNTNDPEVVAEAIGVPATAIDIGYGVVSIYPALNRCAVRVDYVAFSM